MQSTTVTTTDRSPFMLSQLWLIALIAGIVATVIDLVIAAIATPIVHAPPDYPSFSFMPLMVGCVGGALAAAFVFSRIRHMSRLPARTFLIVAAIVLIASYALPIMPIVFPLPRFAGVNWGIAFALMIIHTVTAVIIVGILLAWSRAKPVSSANKLIAVSV